MHIDWKLLCKKKLQNYKIYFQSISNDIFTKRIDNMDEILKRIRCVYELFHLINFHKITKKSEIQAEISIKLNYANYAKHISKIISLIHLCISTL